MKINFLKFGVIGGIALLSVTGFSSCDSGGGNDKSDDSSETSGQTIPGFPHDASAVVAGVQFRMDIAPASKFKFKVISANQISSLKVTDSENLIVKPDVSGSGILSVTTAKYTTIYSDVVFSFIKKSASESILRIEDARSSNEEVLAKLHTLFSSGGSLESEFNELQNAAPNNQAKIEALSNAIARKTSDFIIDVNNQGSLYIVKNIKISSQTAEFFGPTIHIDPTTGALTLGSTSVVVSPTKNLTFTSP